GSTTVGDAISVVVVFSAGGITTGVTGAAETVRMIDSAICTMEITVLSGDASSLDTTACGSAGISPVPVSILFSFVIASANALTARAGTGPATTVTSVGANWANCFRKSLSSVIASFPISTIFISIMTRKITAAPHCFVGALASKTWSATYFPFSSDRLLHDHR